MDIRMPGMSGIECTRRLVYELPELTVVMVTAAFGEQVTRESIQAGCRGYLVKPYSIGQLWSELACALARSISLEPIRADVPTSPPAQSQRNCPWETHCSFRLDITPPAFHVAPSLTAPPLTRREEGIMRLLASGLAEKEIADALQLARKTINHHLERIYRKWRAHSKVQAINIWRARA